MRYRKLTPSGDYQFGNQQADFWRDVPDAPAQAVKTRLHLQLGEWFLDLTEGTPWKTRVLGKYTRDTRNPVIQARVLGTRGVRRILSYGSQVNPDTRRFEVQVTIDTIFGRATLVEPI